MPLGSLLAAFLAILLLGAIGWRGMFWIGALPLITLLPLAILKMPESPSWLVARGRMEEAERICARTGMPMPAAPAAPQQRRERAGFAGLFGAEYWLPTLLLGLMSATGLVLVYSLNTWLPELMRRAGFSAQGSLAFLLVLNGGAVLGALAGSRIADRFGPKPVVASCFLIGALSIAVLTFNLPLGVLLAFVAVVGRGRAAPRHSSTGSWRTTTGRTSAAPAWPGAPGSAGWAASAGRCWAVC